MKKFLLSLAAVALAGSAWAGPYKVVTSAGELTDGNFLIVCPSKNKAMAAQSGNYRASVDVAIVDNVINDVPATAQICTIEPNGTNFYIKAGDKYLSWTSGNVCVESADGYALSINIEDTGATTIASVADSSRRLQYNASNPRFAFYTSSQTAIQLYKEDNNGTVLNDPDLSFTQTEFRINIGETFEAPTFVNPHELPVIWESSNEGVASVDENTGVVTVYPVAGTTTISASFAGNDEYKAGNASYTLTVIDPNIVEYTDELIVSLFKNASGVYPTGTTYMDCSYTSSSTGITYSANMAGDKSSIQLRSSNSNSGIVITANPNGYTLTKVEVEWNNGTTSDRQLAVYGNTTAYEKAAGLYTAATQGDELGNLTYNTTTYIDVTDPYKYIGLRSVSGAQYISKITLTYSLGTSTGVESVDSETNAPKEYYNLQGVRVENPGKGLYIVHQGSKTSKVIL